MPLVGRKECVSVGIKELIGHALITRCTNIPCILLNQVLRKGFVGAGQSHGGSLNAPAWSSLVQPTIHVSCGRPQARKRWWRPTAASDVEALRLIITYAEKNPNLRPTDTESVG